MDYTSVSNPPSGFPNVGDSHIGFVGGLTYLNSQALATTAVTYAAGQVVGSLLTFPGLARVAGGSGLLQDVMIQSKSAQSSAQLDLVLFHTAPVTTFVNATALALNTLDFNKVIGAIPINTWTSLGTPCIAQATQLARAYKIGAGAVNGFGVLVARSALTLTSTSDLSLVVKALQD